MGSQSRWRHKSGPGRNGVIGKGSEYPPPRIAGLTLNFSYIPRKAPPPMGKAIPGITIELNKYVLPSDGELVLPPSGEDIGVLSGMGANGKNKIK